MITAAGALCGVGSMLIASEAAGFKTVGNIEHRKFADTPTFECNFDAKTFNPKKENIDHSIFKDLDLIVGHPSCGSFSTLNTRGSIKIPVEIYEFIDYIKQYKPRFFIMDNLAKSLLTLPIDYWKEQLSSQYDLFPEWISNWHYGNIQRMRRRLFMIGAHKDEKFIFFPGERDHFKNGNGTVRSVIEDLPPWDSPEINHVHFPDENRMFSWKPHCWPETEHLKEVKLKHVKEKFKDYPVKKLFYYYNINGDFKLKPGVAKLDLDWSSRTIHSGSDKCQYYRPDTMNPLTIRERARIQGTPDSFIFYPINFMESRRDYSTLITQTARFIPIQAVKFICDQIKSHIENKPFKASGRRLLKPNPIIDHAKRVVCNCSTHSQTCWLKKSCIFR